MRERLKFPGDYESEDESEDGVQENKSVQTMQTQETQEEVRASMASQSQFNQPRTPVVLDRSDYQADYIDYDEPGFFDSSQIGMSNLLNDSIVSSTVATPKFSTKASQLNWITKTPNPTAAGSAIRRARKSIREENYYNDENQPPSATNSPAPKHFIAVKGEDQRYVLARPKISKLKRARVGPCKAMYSFF